MMRIGLIGAGWVTQHHLDAYRQLSDRARVVAIADPSAAARESRATTYDIEGVYADAADMLETERLDAVDIATPRETHAAMCRLAATKNLPILCQKPLAPTLAEAQALVASLSSGPRLMVHENWRFRPHYRLIRKWLDDGLIGNVRQVLMKIFTSGLIPDANRHLYAVDRQPFFATLDRLLLMEVMIHHVDTLRFLLGALALDGARLGHSSSGVRGEDRATLLMSSHKGAAVVLAGDFIAHGYPKSQFDDVEVLGEAGSIRLNGKTLKLIGTKEISTEIDLEANYKASYRDAIAHFLDCVESGAAFETSPADNLETLKIVEEAYQRGDFLA
ncbi:MAG: Gfo/Idh/MocA family protein [Pseudolabrys sp.]